ncbi:MAG: Fe-S cluster assembly protein SufD [Muribaculaceae bacterium]|nr:Fe-S cluster assembly protein SufD [Muribaculaceae bacterium]
MNSLTQYIDLFDHHRDLVDKGSCEVMNALRSEALDILKNSELPRKGSENYETIDLPAILAPDFGLNLARLDIDVNSSAPFQCGVPHLSPSIFFFRNDLYAEAANASENLPEGVFVGSLKRFCMEFPIEAKKFYGHIADMRNPIVALNTLFAQDGIVVHVKEGVKCEKPIQIVGILENGMPLMAVRRLLIIAEKDSEIKLLVCDHTQNNETEFLNLIVSEIIAEENSSIEICEMEESSQKTSRLSAAYVAQGRESHVSATGVTLYNGITRNEYHCSFTGPDAHLKLSGMAIEDRQRMIDTYSVVTHTLPGCHTDELFKYVADDEAVATFSGLIKVMKGASKTEAFQNNRNIIGNEGARVYSKPTLEIYDDDVKCSHGSAIGQLDQKQIFYMRTRGLSEEQARFLLKQAFMADVIDGISMPDFRLRLHALVERRFARGERNCNSCKNLCIPND